VSSLNGQFWNFQRLEDNPGLRPRLVWVSPLALEQYGSRHVALSAGSR
jgi:hypothetical protein